MRPRTFLSLIAVALLSGCSSSVTKPSSTTIDPQIADLQQQLEELKTQVNATTIPIPTTTTTTEAPKAARSVTGSGSYLFESQGFGDDKKYLCVAYVNYSDGTSDNTRFYVSADTYKANDGCP